MQYRVMPKLIPQSHVQGAPEDLKARIDDLKGAEWRGDEEDPDFREGDTSEDSAEFSDGFEDEFGFDEEGSEVGESEEDRDEEVAVVEEGGDEEEEDGGEEEDEDVQQKAKGQQEVGQGSTPNLSLNITGVAEGGFADEVASERSKREQDLDPNAIDSEFEEMVQRRSPRAVKHATCIQKVFRGKRARMFARFGELPPEMSYMSKHIDKAGGGDDVQQHQKGSARSTQSTARNPYKQSLTLNLMRNKAVLSESASAKSLVLNHYGVEDQTLKAMARSSSSYSRGKTKRAAQTKRAYINSQSLGSLHLEKELAVEIIELRDNSIDGRGADGGSLFCDCDNAKTFSSTPDLLMTSLLY